jgi:hypothetical protein
VLLKNPRPSNLELIASNRSTLDQLADVKAEHPGTKLTDMLQSAYDQREAQRPQTMAEFAAEASG